MSTFQKMKENMISGQFLPGLIKDEKLLNVFIEIEREKYLPKHLRHLAYSDINIKVDKERYLISPYCIAKIIEKSKIKSKDIVLLIGSSFGYESAIISKLSNTVISIEENINFHRQAEINIKDSLIDNVVCINGNYSSGYKKFSPYDIIIFLGSANFPSEILLSQLSENGKLLICENYNSNLDEGKLFMYTKINKNIFKEYICDLNVPKLNADIYQKSIFSLESK